MDIFKSEGINCCQSQADADFLISSTAIGFAPIKPCPVVLVGNDTDLLVMLVANSNSPNVYMQFAKDSVYSIHKIQQALDPQVRSNILTALAMTGCDTVSALYGIGKKKAINMLQKS